MITNFNRVLAQLYVIKFIKKEMFQGLGQKFLFLAPLCRHKIVNLYIGIAAHLVMLRNRGLICMHLVSEMEIYV